MDATRDATPISSKPQPLRDANPNRMDDSKIQKSNEEVPKIIAPNSEQKYLTDYEIERLENIKRNKARLAALEMQRTKNDITAAMLAEKKKNSNSNNENGGETKKKRRKEQTLVDAPLRRSSRKNKGQAGVGDSFANAMLDEAALAAWMKAEEKGKDELLFSLTCEEWCQKANLPPGPKMDGSFKGWVEEETRIELGIAESADEAWMLNGGGTFKECGKPKKGESAKEFARKSMLKNPNAYFYRHNKPGEEQYGGAWSEKEIEMFLEVAREWGCGDKWGLFASHIPHRVGYQCSAIYRQVIIPRGLLLDDNFRLTGSGEAIWAGKKGPRG